jgi:soluble lytic murein transglycosylase-like protein
MATPELRKIIETKANKYGLDPDLVEAEIQKESYPMWNEKSKRFESGFFRTYIMPMKITDPVEREGRATSWGLMQVMGQVARELGYQGSFEGLFEPNTGIEYGCKKLSKCVKRYPDDLDSAIAAYNAGSAVKNADGTFRNQSYVDGVRGYLAKIKSAA